MFVKEIWRYPVKTMAGETVERTPLGVHGIPGDRIVQARDASGREITSRTHPRLLGHKGTLGGDGMPLVDGRRWDSPEVNADVAGIIGAGASLVHDMADAARFDVLPLLVTSDGAIAEFGHDRRRLRANLIIGGVEGLGEREWPGHQLRIGKAVIGVRELRKRCVMTTWDPDTQDGNPEVLKEIVRKFGGSLALNCWVVEEGEIAVGDPVELI